MTAAATCMDSPHIAGASLENAVWAARTVGFALQRWGGTDASGARLGYHWLGSVFPALAEVVHAACRAGRVRGWAQDRESAAP
jgi:hypothetical protein